MSIRQTIISLGETLQAQERAAHDLWTWLAEHKVTVEAKGDYADEFRPDPEDVMDQASAFLSMIQDDLGEERFAELVEKRAATFRAEWLAEFEADS